MNHRENVETGKPKDRAIAQEAWLIMKVNGGTNKQLSREAIPKHARSAPALLVARFQLKKKRLRANGEPSHTHWPAQRRMTDAKARTLKKHTNVEQCTHIKKHSDICFATVAAAAQTIRCRPENIN